MTPWFENLKLLLTGQYRWRYIDDRSRNSFYLSLYGINVLQQHREEVVGQRTFLARIRNYAVLAFCQLSFLLMIGGNMAYLNFEIFSTNGELDVIKLINSIFVIIGVSFVAAVQLLSHLFKSRLSHLVANDGQRSPSTISGWRVFTRQLDITERALPTERIIRAERLFFYFNCVAFAVVELAPLMHTVVGQVPLGDVASLQYPFWYPVAIDTPLRYAVVYAIQFVCGLLLILVMFSNMSFLLTVAGHFYNEFHDLKFAIECTVARSSTNSRLLTNSRTTRSAIVLCIKRHRDLTKSFGQFKNWFRNIFMNGLTWGLLELILLSYSVSCGKNSLGAQIETAMLTANMITFLLVYCLVGEIFYNLNNAVNETIYNVEWYKLSIDLQKLLYVFSGQTKGPLIVKSFVFPATLHTFTEIIKITYRYVNFLMAALK